MLRPTIPLLTLVALFPLVGAADGPFVARGHFYAGDPVAYSLLDACTTGAQEGIDSNCVALPAYLGHKRYTLRAQDEAGAMLATSGCFYTADFSYVQCDPWNRRVPSWASYVSISALGGVHVYWTFIAEA